ncbi:MAG: transposase [Candidatus Methanofastidiosia archaeon]
MQSIFENYPQNGLISVLHAKVTHGDAHDFSILREFLAIGICKNETLFVDKGYDAEETFREAYKLELTPMIKQRDSCTHSLIRLKARSFDEEQYKKYRGKIEGVFGGTETKYENKTRCVLWKMLKNSKSF